MPKHVEKKSEQCFTLLSKNVTEIGGFTRRSLVTKY